IDRIVSKIGRRVDESSPMVDARLADGSRVNAIIPPLAIDGPILSIRKFGIHKITVDDLMRLETLTPPIAKMLQAAVQSRLNILVSGGTGSGKTTLLNILSSFIPASERILTIEDAAELQLRQEHVVRLETRPPNIEGKGVVMQRDLVRNALRMRPDRIIVGEVRGAEALDMLQAMNTGHDGSLTTLHANSTRDALRRLETMILMAGSNLTERAMREQISSAINLVVQIARLSDGSRKVMKISEITGMEGETISLQDIFIFEKMGVREDGRVLGGFRTMGLRPKFAEQLEASGIDLPVDLFEPKLEVLVEKEEAS
ncbi:MAG TPA: CpaF family protein, partial [bacterium]